MSNPFVPCFILPQELQAFGLPTPDASADILIMVQLASSAIDEYCGRIDGDGNGSLVYSTYEERILLQTRNRNLIQLAQKPIIGLSPSQVFDLQVAASGNVDNYFYTGVQASTFTQVGNGQLSGIVAASGRYGYLRQDASYTYPDAFQFLNPLNLVTLFGGPAPWVLVDITNMDVDPRTGEVWIPAGLQLQRYSEVDITYTSGFDPANMPRLIKMATVALVKNAMARGGGTTGMMNISVPKSASFGFYSELIDPTLQRMLTPFVSVRAT
jgi:hypothetical protein